MMGFPIIVDVHGLLKMDTFGKGMKSFPISSLLVTVTETPLDLLPYIRISNSISLSHTLPLVLHFMLVLDSSLFVFYHVSSPHIPSVPYTSLFSSRLSYKRCSHIHTQVIWDRAF